MYESALTYYRQARGGSHRRQSCPPRCCKGREEEPLAPALGLVVPSPPPSPCAHPTGRPSTHDFEPPPSGLYTTEAPPPLPARRADPLRVSLAYPAAPATPCTCDSLEETCAAETAREGRTRGRTEGVRGSHTEGLLPSRRRSKTRLQRQLQCTGGTAPSTNSAKPRALCRRRAAAATGAAADCRPFHGR